MSESIEPTKRLIRAAKKGDPEAANELIRMIKDHHMAKRIGRYMGRNVVISDNDVESEFLLGCYRAMAVVHLNKGNPLLYILWRGQMAVKTLIRREFSKRDKGVRFTCHCGATGSVVKLTSTGCCPKCGSYDVHTWMVEQSLDEPMRSNDRDYGGFQRAAANNRRMGRDAHEMLPASDRDLEWERLVYGVQIEELRSRLNGRVLQLFDLIVLEGIDRGGSRNYLKEIADRWGVSTAAVSVYLRKLRAAVLEYLKES